MGEPAPASFAAIGSRRNLSSSGNEEACGTGEPMAFVILVNRTCRNKADCFSLGRSVASQPRQNEHSGLPKYTKSIRGLALPWALAASEKHSSENKASNLAACVSRVFSGGRRYPCTAPVGPPSAQLRHCIRSEIIFRCPNAPAAQTSDGAVHLHKPRCPVRPGRSGWDRPMAWCS